MNHGISIAKVAEWAMIITIQILPEIRYAALCSGWTNYFFSISLLG